MTTNNLVDVVRHYQRSIERHQEDQGRLLHCVTKLYSLPIKVEHLQETGVGKTVNSLRKFNGEVGAAAKTLVTKWKAMVAAEEEPVGVKSTEMDQNKCKSRSSSDEDQDENKQNNSSSGEEQNRQTLTADLRKHDSSHHNHRKSSSDEKRKHSEHKSSNSSRHRSPSKSHEKSHHKSSRDKSQRSGDRASQKEDKKSEEKKHRESKTKVDSKNSSSSSKRKRESSNERDQKHSKDRVLEKDHEEERHKEHRSERDKHKSGKDSKEHSSRSKDDKHRHNHSSKQDHKHSDKHKSHSSSSKTNTKRSSNSFKNAEEDIDPDAKRQRNDSDEHVEKSPEIKITKAKSKSKHRHDVGVNASSDEEDEADEAGFDSSMGANFADVLGMLNAPMSSAKKTKKVVGKSSSATNLPSSSSTALAQPSTSTRSPPTPSTLAKKVDKTTPSKNIINGVNNELTATRKPDLLSSSAKLEPLDPTIVLDLPTISTNYKPMPLNQTVMDVVFSSTSSVSASSSAASTYKPSVRVLDESELLAQGISSKTMRTKIYSGVRPGVLFQVPSLFDLCIRVLQKNIDALEYTGGVPFDVLRPVLERATPQQLLTFEDYNPYLMEDSDDLWRMHVQRQYRTQRRQEMETWREMFLRCQEEKDHKLTVLAESIKQQQKMNEAPVRKTQLAFVDSMVKPPRGVQRRQDQYGTRGKLIATPAARVPALSKVTPNAAKAGDARLRVIAAARDTAQMAVAPARSKKAPLMAKTLQFIRGRQKR